MAGTSKMMERVYRTADDLTTMEINTIVKNTMTGMKTSDKDSIALYELAGIYAIELERIGNHYEEIYGDLSFDSPFADLNEMANDEKAFLHREKNGSRIKFRIKESKAKEKEDGISVSIETSERRNFFRPFVVFDTGGVFSFRELAIWSNAAANWLADKKEGLSESAGRIEKDRNQLGRIAAKCMEMAKMIEVFFEASFADEDGRGEKVMRVGRPEVRALIRKHTSDNQKESEKFDPATLKEIRVDNWQSATGLDILSDDAMADPDWGEAMKNSLRLLLQYFSARHFPPEGESDVMYPVAEVGYQNFIDSLQIFGNSPRHEEGNEFRLDLRDRMMLRKSIDIGVEHIIMQTRIGIDGDITTRVAQSFADEPIQFVLNMHNTSIEISVNFWNKIFDTLVSFFQLFIKKRT